MFTVSNLTTNALRMDDNTMLAPVGSDGSTRKIEENSKLLRGYAKRDWVSIFEEKEAETTRVESAETSQSSAASTLAKKEGDKKR